MIATVLPAVSACSLGRATPSPSKLPAVCSTVDQTTSSTPFAFNTDYRRREEIVGMRVSWGTDDIGGIVYLQDLPLPVVAQLYEEGFVDPDERQNASPTVREILAFVCRHPSVLVSGYMVGPERDDYRMAFCAVRLPPRYVTQSAREEFLDLCKDADELDDSVELYCWWD